METKTRSRDDEGDGCARARRLGAPPRRRAAALLLVCAAAAAALLLPAPALAAGGGSKQDGYEGGDWEIPDMQESLQDAWAKSEDVVAAPPESCKTAVPAVKSAGCPQLLSPGASWWTGDADRKNAFLMSVLTRDNYPIKHNLGADGDNTPARRAEFQCLMRAKWAALGAERVEFYDSPLNTITILKVGSDVFANLRGTWTKPHRDNNMEWRLTAKQRIWGVPVRYHTGWGKTAEDAYSAIKDAIRKMGVPRDQCRLWLSGHSRGGGAALLVAAFADGRDGAAAPCRVAGVWTFGSVKPFDAAFVDVYNSMLGSKTWNWWYGIDMVPTLPPTFTGYSAQIPRLRIGANFSCPTGLSTNPCIRIAGRVTCPKHQNELFNHHDYEYTTGLGICARATLDLTDECVDALAPPYLAPAGQGTIRSTARRTAQYAARLAAEKAAAAARAAFARAKTEGKAMLAAAAEGKAMLAAAAEEAAELAAERKAARDAEAAERQAAQEAAAADDW